MIKKVPETVIHLKVDEEQWKAAKRCKGQMGKGRAYTVKVLVNTYFQ